MDLPQQVLDAAIVELVTSVTVFIQLTHLTNEEVGDLKEICYSVIYFYIDMKIALWYYFIVKSFQRLLNNALLLPKVKNTAFKYLKYSTC